MASPHDDKYCILPYAGTNHARLMFDTGTGKVWRNNRGLTTTTSGISLISTCFSAGGTFRHKLSASPSQNFTLCLTAARCGVNSQLPAVASRATYSQYTNSACVTPCRTVGLQHVLFIYPGNRNASSRWYFAIVSWIGNGIGASVARSSDGSGYGALNQYASLDNQIANDMGSNWTFPFPAACTGGGADGELIPCFVFKGSADLTSCFPITINNDLTDPTGGIADPGTLGWSAPWPTAGRVLVAGYDGSATLSVNDCWCETADIDEGTG